MGCRVGSWPDPGPACASIPIGVSGSAVSLRDRANQTLRAVARGGGQSSQPAGLSSPGCSSSPSRSPAHPCRLLSPQRAGTATSSSALPPLLLNGVKNQPRAWKTEPCSTGLGKGGTAWVTRGCMAVTRGDKDCPGRVWVAGARQDGQKYKSPVPVHAARKDMRCQPEGRADPRSVTAVPAWPPAVSRGRESPSSQCSQCFQLPQLCAPAGSG